MSDDERPLAALLPALRRGVPIDEVKAAARATAADPQCIQALLDLLIHPSGFSRIQCQKAAWILHHAFQLDERAFLPLRADLGRALDATEDPSALRELLKVLASPLWADAETEAQRTDALELATGLLYVEDAPIAVHYAAMQTLQSRAQYASEVTEALEALNALHGRLGAENAPLRTCAERYIKRFRQKLARTKSPS
jgi:hypothetical protein